MSDRRSAGKRVMAIAVFDGVEMLDVAGPVQVFSTASRTTEAVDYDVVIVAAEPGPVRTSSGVPLIAERGWGQLGADIHTLVVPGGLRDDGRGPLVDQKLVEWLRSGAPMPGRVVSVCTGAHTLAAAGLLTGRSATTHWSTADLLAAEHPDITVASDAIFVNDGPVWTSAGVSAGIDLALALVAADNGEAVARLVAQWLVVHLRRTGGQHQFSALLGPRRSTSERIAQLLAWIPEHLRGDLSVDALAMRINVSPRHLSRLLRDELDTTPAALVERMRVQAAVDQLLHTDAPIATVATQAGFGSVASLHRAFARVYKVTPGQYRRQFSTRVDLDESTAH
ncbi:GlxA family transcriptional regulator [Nocardioides sp. NPDC059952]|uniref:GlxA family transcriptional regulator n=1 Tax=Nocardioides sp. NPDC059952 TaxID=3347014 RepID=UPI0036619219